MKSWISKGLNRSVLLVLYVLAIGASYQLNSPFHGYQRTIWEGLKLLIILTSAMDVLFSRILTVFPVGAAALGVVYGFERHQFTRSLLIMHAAWLIGFLMMTWMALRLTRQSWARGDWLVTTVVVFFLPPAFSATWLAGTLVLVSLYHWGMQHLRLGIATLPLLPFAFISYELATLIYGIVLVR